MESSKRSYLAVNGICVCADTRPRCKIAPRVFTARQTFVLLFNRMPQLAERYIHTHRDRHMGKKTTNKQSTNSVGQ